MELKRVMNTEIFFTVLGGIGSIIGIVVAIAKFVNRPKLKLRLRSSLGEPTCTNHGVPQIYYHLEVLNKRSKNPAENVRVFATDVWKRHKMYDWSQALQSGPLQLPWQFSNPHESAMPKTIGPTYLCDLGVIDSQGFKLLAYSLPNNFSGYLDCEGELKVTFIAQGDNATSNELKLKIKWNGEWDKNEKTMERNLIIEDITSQHS